MTESPVPPEFAAALTEHPEDSTIKYALADYWEERGRSDWAAGWAWMAREGKWPDGLKNSWGDQWCWDNRDKSHLYPHLPKSASLPATVHKLLIDLDGQFTSGEHRYVDNTWWTSDVVGAFNCAVLRVSMWLSAGVVESVGVT